MGDMGMGERTGLIGNSFFDRIAAQDYRAQDKFFASEKEGYG